MVRTERYLAEHPDASFEEVEAACFPGEDGKLQLFAISPRHLEACATRTCQVLVEGEYSGVLRAGEHYIPIAKDLSNVEEVLDIVQSDSERERITANAYRDVVASGDYTYRGLVEKVEGESGLSELAEPRQPATPELERLHRRAEAADRRSWVPRRGLGAQRARGAARRRRDPASAVDRPAQGPAGGRGSGAAPVAIGGAC